MAANAGLCVGGPFDGRQCAQPSYLGPHMPIIHWGAGWMHEAEIRQLGHYLFEGGRWIWNEAANSGIKQ